MNDFLQTLRDAALPTAIREGASLFPWIETVHVVAITLVVGTIAIVDLRLLGYRAHRAGVKRLIRELLPYTWAAFGLAAITGALLFASKAPAYWANPWLRAKAVLLLLAGVNMALFHTTAYRTVDAWDERLPPPAAARFAGAASLLLWMAVVVCGRWVGFTT